MENILAGLLMVIGAALFGLAAGSSVRQQITADDCRSMGQFRIESTVFDCKERSK